MITAKDAVTHRKSLAANPDKWGDIDFEMLSDELHIEINAEMSTIVVRKAIEGRLAEMSVQQYEKVSAETWDYLASIQILGKFEVAHKTTDRLGMFPLRLKKLGKDTISLSPVGASVSSLWESISSNKSWVHLEESIGASAKHETGHIVIHSRCFYPWTERQLVEIFQSMECVAAMPNMRTYLE